MGERVGAGMLGRVVDTGEISTTLVDTEVSASYRLKYSCICGMNMYVCVHVCMRVNLCVCIGVCEWKTMGDTKGLFQRSLLMDL